MVRRLPRPNILVAILERKLLISLKAYLKQKYARQKSVNRCRYINLKRFNFLLPQFIKNYYTFFTILLSGKPVYSAFSMQYFVM